MYQTECDILTTGCEKTTNDADLGPNCLQRLSAYISALVQLIYLLPPDMVTGLLLTALVLTDPILTVVSFLSIVKSETKIKYEVTGNQAFS